MSQTCTTCFFTLATFRPPQPPSHSCLGSRASPLLPLHSPADLGGTTSGHTPAECHAYTVQAWLKETLCREPRKIKKPAGVYMEFTPRRRFILVWPVHLLHKMACYECFRQVFSSNLDTICNVSAIPDCPLQPVLEKVPPHQLHRRETCN